MVKRIFTLSIVAGLFIGMPMAASANSSIEIIEQTLQNIDISVSQSIIHVTGAAGQDMYVYNITGVRVKSIHVDSNDKRYDLNLPKGCYIVKVGKVVRKISIR